jgi:hypothetical protein
MPEVELYLDATTGELMGVYSPELAEAINDLREGLGGLVSEAVTRRASHVEPGPDGRWYADLSPVGGPVLGPYPFEARDVALAAEVAWLRANYLARPASERGAGE